jgi:hypothetical protein
MKLGLDLHGVIDKHPLIFKELARSIITSSENSVYIISGASKDKIIKTLDRLDFTYYTYIFSIQDYLNENYFHLNEGINYNDGNHIYNDDLWDSIKGEFCRKEKLDLHIDDWEEYGKYFSTPFLHMRG